MISIEEQIKIITKGADEVINIEDLEYKLNRSKSESRPLIVKLGLDPTAPDIHLGHTVVLRKIKQIQDLGHRAVIVIGDFTGMIGDPTGRSKTRRQLSREEVLENAKTYEKQIFKILDEKKTDIHFNSEWLAKLNFASVINLSSKYTVARMLEREDFKNRFACHETIGIHEFFYPLMQGYDSVALKADIELGGKEQRFNILVGRTLQKDFGQDSQVGLFMPVLEGTDGIEKMSKSLGNYIGIDEEPGQMFVKVMSIPDNLIIKYFELATDIHPYELSEIKVTLENGTVNPRDVKMRLAREITGLYHGKDAALRAEENFINLFQKRIFTEDIPVTEVNESMFVNGKVNLIKLITEAGLASSGSEARRLIQQGAVRINGLQLENIVELVLQDGDVLQVGKKNFIRVKL